MTDVSTVSKPAQSSKSRRNKERRKALRQQGKETRVQHTLGQPGQLLETPSPGKQAKGCVQPAARQPFVPGPAFVPPKQKTGKGSVGVLDRMRQRLSGSRFRWLNEQMYTSEGGDAQRLLQQHPQYFDEYHEGFREQTRAWPQLPVDAALAWLSSCPLSWRVADLGCGDAVLAARAKQRVLSYDLVARTPGVVAANMADLPLGESTVDAAVLCLALMGTDYPSFLREAVRILKKGGVLWIAEVQSRFMQDTGTGSVLEQFIEAVQGLGTRLEFRDEKNPFFLLLRFKKSGKATGEEDADCWPMLRACQYKKR